MRRSLGLLLLLLSLLWQSAHAMDGRWAAAAGWDDGHADLHWVGEAHHHHDDGTYHADDSTQSLVHVQFDGAPQLTALLPSTVRGLAAQPHATPAVTDQLCLPSPPPRGLRRPPRFLA